MRMTQRLLLSLLLVACLAACATTAQKKKVAEAKEKAKQIDLQDLDGDPDFLSFVGVLRKAVGAHDVNTLAPMMTTNFGYSLNPPAEGAGVFQYWDQTNAWPQIEAVLQQHFLPKGSFMVAPPAFATDPNYHGYRAGLTTVDGNWRFAYFVTD
jgi:hypothetical protein